MKALVERLLPYRRPLLVAVHCIFIGVAYFLAFLIRYDFQLKPHHWDVLAKGFPYAFVIQMGVFWRFRLFKGLWRYVSVNDLIEIFKAVSIGALLFMAAILMFVGREFPRSIYVLDWIFLFILVSGLRMVRRVLGTLRARWKYREKRSVIIVGAGNEGEMLIREIERNHQLDYKVIGVVDTDSRNLGDRIHGVEVIGTVNDLPLICQNNPVKEIIIAESLQDPERRRKIIGLCLRTGVPFKRIPVIGEVLEGKAKIHHFQEVDLEELLGRPPTTLNLEGIPEAIRGKRIMVTGAGGSIGTELCRQLAKHNPELIVLFERGESSLYFVDLALKDEFSSVKTVPVVGDILNQAQLREVIGAYLPHLVYHAAAYKHVPLMEEHPLEAVENNVFGTERVAIAAMESNVEKFIFISTDKAVNPVGIMGMTKFVAERLLRTLNGGPTKFVAVRFGNVIGSQGSVLPLFYSQIVKGGPVTITHPDAARYFMNLSEAAELVIYAGVVGENNEVFFLDMGTPIKIMGLAQAFVRSLGLEPDQDISFEVIGLRPGERLNEELTVAGEEILAVEGQRVIRVQNSSVDTSWFSANLEELRAFVCARDQQGAVWKLKAMTREMSERQAGARLMEG